jgi:hypothetical protein
MYANSNSIMLSRHYIFLLWSFKMAILNTRFRPTLAHVGVSMGWKKFWKKICIFILPFFKFKLVLCFQNYSDLMWEKKVLGMLLQKRCQLIVGKFGTELSLDILGTLPAHLGPSWGSMIFSFSSLRSSAVVFTNNSRH